MSKFYIADNHFNHKLMAELRGFASPLKMNLFMFEYWNSIVRNGDLVYFLGDLAMPNKGDGNDIAEILAKLNGQIYFVLGNHDWKNINLFRGFERKIIKMVDLAYIKTSNGYPIMLCHYSMQTWRKSCHGSWHLFAHSHGKVQPIGLSHDVGVDNNGFVPLSEIQIEKIMLDKIDEKCYNKDDANELEKRKNQ